MRKYEQFAEQNLQVVVRNGSEWMVRCVFHDNEGSPAMQFNVEKGLFICFSCDAKGGMKTLSKKLGLRYQDPGIGVNELRGKLNRLRDQSGKDPHLTIRPESDLTRFDFPTGYWGQCPSKRRPTGCTGRVGCPLHRWLTDETVEAFDLGYDPLNDAAMIPVRIRSGGLVGFITRYLDPDWPVKYKYPRYFKRQSEMFGSWLIEEEPDDDVAVVTEGSIDSMKVWQAGSMGLCSYGSSISAAQIRLMLRLGIREVCLFTDNDKAGRKMRRRAIGWKKHNNGGWEYDETLDLRKHFVVKKVLWTPDIAGNDPGSCTDDEIRYLIDSRIRMT